MKKNTMLSTVLAAMMMVSAGSAMAETHLLTKDVKVVKRDNKKIEVKVNQPNVGKLDVELKDKDGVVLYAGTIKGGENITTRFNLNALPNGEYLLNCSNADFWSLQQLSIKNGSIDINEDSYQEAVTPKVEAFAANRFEVTTSNKNVADMTVVITDTFGEIVYSNYLSAGSKFNMSHLPTGDYTFELTVANKSFKKLVTVK